MRIILAKNQNKKGFILDSMNNNRKIKSQTIIYHSSFKLWYYYNSNFDIKWKIMRFSVHQWGNYFHNSEGEGVLNKGEILPAGWGGK